MASTTTVKTFAAPSLPPSIFPQLTILGQASADAQDLKAPITSPELFTADKAVRERQELHVLEVDGEVVGYAKTGFKDL